MLIRDRRMMSTRRFWPRPSAVALEATGWNSAYPDAESRPGTKWYRSMKISAICVALVVDSSQLDANWLVWIGTSSVWPSMRMSYGTDNRDDAMASILPM